MKVFFVLWVCSLLPSAHAATEPKELIRVKNFRQAVESLAVATGVPATTPSIRAYYSTASTRLPRDGRAEEVTPAMLLTFGTLASLFCKEMIESDSQLAPDSRHALAAVDFSQGPDALTSAVIDRVADSYSLTFWERAPSRTERATLAKVMSQAQPSSATPIDKTKAVLLLGCTAAATSLAFMIQ